MARTPTASYTANVDWQALKIIATISSQALLLPPAGLPIMAMQQNGVKMAPCLVNRAWKTIFEPSLIKREGGSYHIIDWLQTNNQPLQTHTTLIFWFSAAPSCDI